MGLCASKPVEGSAAAAAGAPAAAAAASSAQQPEAATPAPRDVPTATAAPSTGDAFGGGGRGGAAAATTAAPEEEPLQSSSRRNVTFDVHAGANGSGGGGAVPADDPYAAAAPAPPPAVAAAATATAAAAAATAAAAAAAAAPGSTPSSPSATGSDAFSPLSPQIELLRAKRQQRLRDRRGPSPVGAAAAAAAAAAASGGPPDDPLAAPAPASQRVPRGGCFSALQDALDADARAAPCLDELRTRAAGVKHIGFGPFKRENQDEFAISLGQAFGGLRGGNLFCVFDGHGACGKDAAAYARQQLPLLLDAEMRAYGLRAGADGGGERALKGSVEVLLAEAFSDTERALQRAGVNLASSGTTATVVYQRGNRLWVASAGDSRVVLCSRVDVPAAAAAAAAVAADSASGGRFGGGSGGGGGFGGGSGGSGNTNGPSAGGAGAAALSQQQQQQQMAAAAQAVLSAVGAPPSDNSGGGGHGHGSGAGGASLETSGGGGGGGGANPTADADGAGVAGPPRRIRGAPGLWRATPLTIDHRPRRLSERRRVEAAGGRVAPKRLPSGRAVGEPRLWLADLPSPGLLLSRSLGDLMAASVGCTHDPEVTYATLRPHRDRFMVLASDGVWDVLGNAQVCELVAGAGSPHAGCRAVLDAALGEWEERMSADNVTVVVVEFDWGEGGAGGGE